MNSTESDPLASPLIVWETRGDPGSEGTDQDVTRHPNGQVCDLT
jgi:hypothetical protein